MNRATTADDLAVPAGPKSGAPPEASPGDPQITPPPAADRPGGMIGEGEAGAPTIEGVESEAETSRGGGMIGEG